MMAKANSIVLFSCVILAVLFLANCGGEGNIVFDEPDHSEDMRTFSPLSHQPDTVELVKKVIFESNDEIFMPGYIGRLAVDSLDRVYISSSGAGKVGIYVFDPNGSHITTLGRFGQGPGEFESISSISIVNNRLYLLCARTQKVVVFNLDDFSHVEDVVIKWDMIRKSDSVANRLRVHQLYVDQNGHFLVRLQSLATRKEVDVPIVLILPMSHDGMLQPESLLETARFELYFHSSGSVDFPFTMPFTRKSLISVRKNGSFLTAWTEDFLIKSHDRNGNIEKFFQYPVKKSLLSIRDFHLKPDRERALSKYSIPDTWPVLYTMTLDDSDRLWIASITESDSTFTWWILGNSGRLLARFVKPGNRQTKYIMSEPTLTIRNGNFYSHEFDLIAGIDRIIKYEINFKKQY